MIPTLMGWGIHPRQPPAERRHGRPADLAPLRQRHACWPRTSSSASVTGGPTGTPAASRPTPRGRKFVHVDIEPTQIGRVFAPDYGIVSDARAALELFVAAARERSLRSRDAWAEECQERKRTMWRKTNFDDVPSSRSGCMRR